MQNKVASAAIAAKITGRSTACIAGWHRHGLKTDAVFESGEWRRYSLRDLTAISTMGQLVDAGVSREDAAMIVNDDVRSYFDAPGAFLCVRLAPLQWEISTVGSSLPRLTLGCELEPGTHAAAIVIRVGHLCELIQKRLEEEPAK